MKTVRPILRVEPTTEQLRSMTINTGASTETATAAYMRLYPLLQVRWLKCRRRCARVNFCMSDPTHSKSDPSLGQNNLTRTRPKSTPPATRLIRHEGIIRSAISWPDVYQADTPNSVKSTNRPDPCVDPRPDPGEIQDETHVIYDVTWYRAYCWRREISHPGRKRPPAVRPAARRPAAYIYKQKQSQHN